jgi:hypothetical protein
VNVLPLEYKANCANGVNTENADATTLVPGFAFTSC